MVSLQSSRPTEIDVPDVITIAGGTTEVTFDLFVKADLRVDSSPNMAEISAEVAGWSSALQLIEIIDDDD